MARKNWLAIAGISENGDFTKNSKFGDNVMSILQEPWEDNGMKVEFSTYDL